MLRPKPCVHWPKLLRLSWGRVPSFREAGTLVPENRQWKAWPWGGSFQQKRMKAGASLPPRAGHRHLLWHCLGGGTGQALYRSASAFPAECNCTDRPALVSWPQAHAYGLSYHISPRQLGMLSPARAGSTMGAAAEETVLENDPCRCLLLGDLAGRSGSV